MYHDSEGSLRRSRLVRIERTSDCRSLGIREPEELDAGPGVRYLHHIVGEKEIDGLPVA